MYLNFELKKSKDIKQNKVNMAGVGLLSLKESACQLGPGWSPELGFWMFRPSLYG